MNVIQYGMTFKKCLADLNMVYDLVYNPQIGENTLRTRPEKNIRIFWLVGNTIEL